MRRIISLITSAALLATLIVASLPAVASADTNTNCTLTGFSYGGITDMTAAVVDPSGAYNATLDATGCDIGVYFGSNSGTVSGATISGANWFGVVVNGAAADVTGARISDIGWVGIYYAAGSSGTVSGNAVSNYQKGGIVANGTDASVTIGDNTVTGLGPGAVNAQNGIQVSRGASAVVTGNAISDNYYSGPYWSAAALLLFDVSANAVMTSANHFVDNQRNLLLVTAQACPSMYGGVYDGSCVYP